MKRLRWKGPGHTAVTDSGSGEGHFVAPDAEIDATDDGAEQLLKLDGWEVAEYPATEARPPGRRATTRATE